VFDASLIRTVVDGRTKLLFLVALTADLGFDDISLANMPAANKRYVGCGAAHISDELIERLKVSDKIKQGK